MKKRLYGFVFTAALLAATLTPAAAETERIGDDVMNVIVPARLDFTIDPLELAERGQIYSDVQMIENRRDADVLFIITDMRVIFANETDFEARAQPFDTGYDHGADSPKAGDAKAVYMLLDFGRADIASAVLTGAARNETRTIPLGAAGSDAAVCFLSLSGCVNPYPESEWKDGDVKLQLTYSIELPAPPEADRADAEALPEQEVPPEGVSESPPPAAGPESPPPADETSSPGALRAGWRDGVSAGGAPEENRSNEV